MRYGSGYLMNDDHVGCRANSFSYAFRLVCCTCAHEVSAIIRVGYIGTDRPLPAVMKTFLENYLLLIM